MHPVPSIIRASELRSQELRDEARYENLVEQALAGSPRRSPVSGMTTLQALALVTIVAVVIAFVVLVASPVPGSEIQVVASGP